MVGHDRHGVPHRCRPRACRTWSPSHGSACPTELEAGLGQAMIATLRHRLIRVPARLVRHAGALTLRLPPGQHLLAEILARIRALPRPS